MSIEQIIDHTFGKIIDNLKRRVITLMGRQVFFSGFGFDRLTVGRQILQAFGFGLPLEIVAGPGLIEAV